MNRSKQALITRDISFEMPFGELGIEYGGIYAEVQGLNVSKGPKGGSNCQVFLKNKDCV